MKIDAGSVFTMAALSLLTGAYPCTDPTEGGEIRRRAADLCKILCTHGHTIHYFYDTLFPAFRDEVWPFAMTKNELSCAQYEFVHKYFESNEVKGKLDIKAFKDVMISIPEIEEKYRLSKVKDSVLLDTMLPF